MAGRSKVHIVVAVAMFGFTSQAWAVDWSGKLGVGGFAESKRTISPIDGDFIELPSVGGGISFNYGVMEKLRLGLDFSFAGSQITYKEKFESTPSIFGFFAGAHGLFDIISKEGGSLYGLLRVGYGRTSSEIEYKAEKETKTEKGPTLSELAVALGAGFEALVAESVGIAFEGSVFSLGFGSVKEEVREGEEEEKKVTTTVDITSIGYALFPSFRILARIYF